MERRRSKRDMEQEVPGLLLGLKRRNPNEDRPALFEQIQSEADEWLRAVHRKDQHESIAGEIQN